MSGGTPYMAGPFTLDVVGGTEEIIELNIPWRATISSFSFTQDSGVAASCDFELYTLAAAAVVAGGSDPAYSVFGEKAFITPTPLAEYDKGYPYVNQDSRATDPTRKLYLRIDPAGTGAKTYKLALSLITSQLG
jgi:hypothetical protein